MSNKHLLIYSGSNDRAIIAFCRYASKNSIPFHIIANGEDDYIFLTDYRKHIIHTRKKNKLELQEIESVLKQIQLLYKPEDILILPSTEYLNRFLLENLDPLKVMGAEIGLCPLDTYHLLSDKYAFGELCKSHNILVPEELENAPNSYPFVAKPKSYKSLTGAIHKPDIISNEKDRSHFLTKANSQDYYFQKYIQGQSFYLLFYIFKSGKYSIYSQENLIQQHNGGSIILAKSSSMHLTETTLINNYATMLTSIGFHGLVMIEVKKQGNDFYMIEANPRLWGPSQLILDSQMSIFDCFAFENNLIQSIPEYEYKTDTWYYWSGGLFADQANDNTSSYHNYSKSESINTLPSIQPFEVFNREDTKQIYNLENKIPS